MERLEVWRERRETRRLPETEIERDRHREMERRVEAQRDGARYGGDGARNDGGIESWLEETGMAMERRQAKASCEPTTPSVDETSMILYRAWLAVY
jgi:hypothetical protein